MLKLKSHLNQFRVKNSNTKYYRRVRFFGNILLKVAYFPVLLSVRRQIIAIVGKVAFERVRGNEVVAFPDHLDRAPHVYHGSFAISKILLALDLKPVHFNKYRQQKLAIDWQDTTVNMIDSLAYINAGYRQSNGQTTHRLNFMINQTCIDISKQKIGELNKAIFNLTLNVDPTTFDGLIVKKSDTNGRHDGQVVSGPIEKKDYDDEYVYTLLIDNIYNGSATDYRLIYIDGLLDSFYQKTRGVDQRFSNKNDLVVLRKLESEFSSEEIQQITEFCKALGADYGELDVLRDRQTKKIAIVDFAKTPVGPPNGLSRKHWVAIVVEMGAAFVNKYPNLTQRN